MSSERDQTSLDVGPGGAPSRVAVVGAGFSGLAAAGALREGGALVTVFEKSRGCGGRAATRRMDGRSFHHGAPSFRAQHPIFAAAASRWVGAGVARRVGERFEGIPGMSSIARHLAGDVDLRCGVLIEEVRASTPGWRVAEENFDAVLLALPAFQAAQLLAPVPGLARRAAAVEMLPCHAALLAFRDPIQRAWGVLEFDHPVLRRAVVGETVVLQSAPEWSERFPGNGAAALAPLLAAAAECLEQSLAPPLFAQVHYWRYAFASRPLGEPSLWDQNLHIGACGDWCLGRDIECAFLSGLHAAARMQAAGIGPSHRRAQ